MRSRRTATWKLDPAAGAGSGAVTTIECPPLSMVTVPPPQCVTLPESTFCPPMKRAT